MSCKQNMAKQNVVKAKHGDSTEMHQGKPPIWHVVQGADPQQSAGTE